MSPSESDRLAKAGAELNKALVASILERWFIWFGDGPDSRGELQRMTDAAAARWPGMGLMASAPPPPADDLDVMLAPPAVAPVDALDDMLG